MIAQKLRIRTCRNKACADKFTPTKPMQSACSIACAIVLAAEVTEKTKRAYYKQRKQALKTRSDYIKAAQIAFNAYVRTRDAGKLCICCDKPLPAVAVGGGFDCGHYRSVGSAPHLRFNPDNAHGQTKQCNRYGAGKAVDYRIGLIARIGLDRVEALEFANEPRKWSIDELIAIRQLYIDMRKQLLKAQA